MSPAWPPSECHFCGTETPMLAQVSDPWVDSCYGVCRVCLGPLNEKVFVQMRAATGEAEGE